jgi:hypothetical protein
VRAGHYKRGLRNFSEKLLSALFEVFDYVHRADVGAHDASAEPKGKDGRVLPEPPPSRAEVVPVGGGVDERGRHQGERGHLDRAQEGDKQVEPGNGGGETD